MQCPSRATLSRYFQFPLESLMPTSTWSKSSSMPPPAVFLPSHWTSTTPSLLVSTGLLGTLGGVTSEATKATTTGLHSPSRSEYVGTARTRNS